jgi:hypothetical protein
MITEQGKSGKWYAQRDITMERNPFWTLPGEGSTEVEAIAVQLANEAFRAGEVEARRAEKAAREAAAKAEAGLTYGQRMERLREQVATAMGTA